MVMFFAAKATRECVYENELYDDEFIGLQMKEVRGGWRVVRLPLLLNVRCRCVGQDEATRRFLQGGGAQEGRDEAEVGGRSGRYGGAPCPCALVRA